MTAKDNTSQTTGPNFELEWSVLAQSREIGTVIRSLYIALGAATILQDKVLIERLAPIVREYRERVKDALEGQPHVV